MLNVGIIGCGTIARKRHAVEYNNNSNVIIKGFYDRTSARAKEMTELYGGSVYETVEEMLEDPTIDAVSVCVANALHAPITIQALNKGKHVLCEKPMAITLEECETMVDASVKNNKKLLIGHNQRLNAAHVKAREIIASGQMGKVLSFQSTFGHKGPELWSIAQSSNTWFFKKDAAVFGSMADLGIHKIDLLCYLLDDKVVEVFSKFVTLDKRFPNGDLIEVDDNSFELLTFEKGAMGSVTTSWTHYGKEANSTVLYCQNGIIRLFDDPLYSLDIVNADGTKIHYELEAMQTNDDHQQINSGVIDTFVDGAINKKRTVLDAELILESMRVVFACKESSEKGKEIRILRV